MCINMTLEKAIVKIKKVFIPCEENDYKPKILAGNFLVYFLIGLIVLKLISLGFLLAFPNNSFFADVSKTALVELLNNQRGESGLSQLVVNPKLNYAAELKAKDMLDNDYFSHNSPQGVDPWHWFQISGYNYHYAGENLGIGFIESEEVHEAWNNSPSHKENLLNANYNEIGIAVLQGNFNGAENTIVVQLFGTQHEKTPMPATVVVTQEKEENEPAPIEFPVEPQAATITKPVEAVIVEVEHFEAPTAEMTSFQGKVMGEFTDATNESIKLKFFRFMAMSYNNLLQRFIFYSLIAVSLLLMINVFVKINVQYTGLTVKVLGLICLLVVCIYINKDIMLKFIPHVVSIY